MNPGTPYMKRTRPLEVDDIDERPTAAPTRLERDRPHVSAMAAGQAAVQRQRFARLSLEPPPSPVRGGHHNTTEAGGGEEEDDDDPEEVYRDDAMALEFALDGHEREKAERYEALQAANAALRERMRPHHVRQCESDLLYALLYAYEACGMDESLQHMVDFVLRQYAMDAPPPGDGGDRRRDNGLHAYRTNADAQVVRETFQYILHGGCENTLVKRALALFILAREPRLQREVRALCPAERFAPFLPALIELTKQTTHAKFNRQNIGSVLKDYVTRCGCVYLDQHMPAELDPQTTVAAMQRSLQGPGPGGAGPRRR